MISFFTADIAILFIAVIGIALIRSQSAVNRIGHGLIAAAMVSGLCFTIQAFFSADPSEFLLYAHPNLGSISLRFDKLSLFFLAIIQTGGIVASVYGTGYLIHYEHGRSLKPLLTATVLLFFSMQILIVADHAILFLAAWEIMALSGYLAIAFEREKEEVRRGSIIFFIAAHAGTLFLYLLFLLLHQQTNSWEFSDFAHHSYLPSVVPAIFWFGFIGFGTKAGFMPFHFWLAEAHPVAPSHISALLSAVMLKTGIYGLLRVILWLQPRDFYIPAALLFISCVTAVFGIWNALAQKDLKRILAYSSIENVGIIGIALSLLMFGIQHQQPLVIFFGLSGALFHTVNHFVFKSLLFMSAGTVYHHYHHRNIEQMGGLMKTAPFLGGIVLIGSVAICGLPPFNGFASEFIIYSGFFEASNSMHAYFPFFMLLAAVALAFVGGLSVLGFSKIVSMVFLGVEKMPVQKPFHFSIYEQLSLSILVIMIVVLGLFPQSIAALCVIIFGELFPDARLPAWNATIGIIQSVGMVAAVVIAVIVLMMIAKMKIVVSRSSRTGLPWGCGYSAVTSRMQYSGTSFSDDIVGIAGKVLNVEKIRALPEHPMPEPASFRTNVKDLMLYKVVIPVSSGVNRVIDLFKWLQSGKIQIYVAFSIMALLLYLFLAFQI